VPSLDPTNCKEEDCSRQPESIKRFYRPYTRFYIYTHVALTQTRGMELWQPSLAMCSLIAGSVPIASQFTKRSRLDSHTMFWDELQKWNEMSERILTQQRCGGWETLISASVLASNLSVGCGIVVNSFSPWPNGHGALWKDPPKKKLWVIVIHGLFIHLKKL